MYCGYNDGPAVSSTSRGESEDRRCGGVLVSADYFSQHGQEHGGVVASASAERGAQYDPVIGRSWRSGLVYVDWLQRRGLYLMGCVVALLYFVLYLGGRWRRTRAEGRGPARTPGELGRRPNGRSNGTFLPSRTDTARRWEETFCERSWRHEYAPVPEIPNEPTSEGTDPFFVVFPDTGDFVIVRGLEEAYILFGYLLRQVRFDVPLDTAHDIKLRATLHDYVLAAADAALRSKLKQSKFP